VEYGEAIIARYKQMFGLDQDLQTQYFSWLREVFLHLNFGPSIINFPTTSQELVARALPWSIGLLSTTTIIAWGIGICLGILAGWRRGKILDNITLTYSLLISQIPYYILALIMVSFFGYGLGWFPVGGIMVTPAMTLEFLTEVLHYSILPALSLILVNSCYWAISSRALTVVVLGEDYLRYAEAKGLSKTRLLFRYVLRNTLLPQVTGLAMSLGGVVGGMYFVEWIFQYPGVGRLFMQAVNFLDYNTIQCVTFVSILVVIMANFLMEILYPLIDPRVIQESKV
jgi:peptide/nickel transport system permease protein